MKLSTRGKMKNYFKPKELRCKCGCGLNNFSPILLGHINEIRFYLGFPLVVKSACRCPSHNQKEGGKHSSDHLTGEGVDVKAIGSQTRFMIIYKAILLGINRIGIAKTFIHLGINQTNPSSVMWIY